MGCWITWVLPSEWIPQVERGKKNADEAVLPLAWELSSVSFRRRAAGWAAWLGVMASVELLSQLLRVLIGECSAVLWFSSMAKGKFGLHHLTLWKSKGLCVQLLQLYYWKHWHAAIFLFVSPEHWNYLLYSYLANLCYKDPCILNVALLLLCGLMVCQTIQNIFPLLQWSCSVAFSMN